MGNGPTHNWFSFKLTISLILGILIFAFSANFASADTPPIQIGISMVGGSIPDGGDDVGPANEVQRMIEADHPAITVSGMVGTTWRQAQPEDPGDGPDVYDWSSLDAKADELIPGKALLAYQQIWGTYPDWVELDTPRFWEKYENFIEAMTIHINENYGTVYYVFENEPNISRAPEGWNWADWYIHCLEHFYAAVHRANAQTGFDNKVIAGNLAGHSANGFEELYARGLKNISDILGYHAYPYDIRDGVCVEDLARIHEIQVAYGDGDKKIYVSEGWGSGRSAGFDRSSPDIEPTAQEIENMWLAMTKGWDNVMTPRENWSPEYLWGMKFFCGNDNWGAMNWRKRAIAQYDDHGNIIGFIVDGYWMTPDIAPYFWNGGMMDFYGNSKDCLIHVFPGDGLVFMNPGFELPSEPPKAHLPHFWTPEVDPAPVANYSLDNKIFHGGSRSLKLSQATPGNNGVWQLTAKRSAKPGLTYRARVWCRTDDISGLTAKFYMRFSNLSGTIKSEKHWAEPLTGTAGWRQMEVIATAPSYTSRIEVGCYIEGVGTAWFDDVTIAEAGQEEIGTVRGYTLDEGQIPVPYCIVRTTTGGYQAVSDENGYYEMQIPTGTYDFVCRKPGYVPHRVKNQTVAAGKLTFVSFNMRIPKEGLTVVDVSCDRDTAIVGGDPVTVTVTVDNAKSVPNKVAEVNLFVEQNGEDATYLFNIEPVETNPEFIPAQSSAQFKFKLTPKPEAQGQTFSVNAYAFGQEDHPNMLENGAFDWSDWDYHWSFSGGADVVNWGADETEYYSPPRSLHCYIYESGDYTWNWAYNWSAYGPNAIPAKPGTNYTVGVYHKDVTTGSVSIDLFINEFYYDGNDWYYNGRRFIGIPHRDVWAEDVMIYQTGSPDMNPGLYPTNRLVPALGPCTGPNPGEAHTWWDDFYLKETGEWLADDRADQGATLSVLPPQTPPGLYKVGWNLTSIPVEASNPDPNAVFQDLVDLGNIIECNLYGFDPALGYESYPTSLTAIERGRGYWLYLSTVEEDTVVAVPGDIPEEDFTIPLSQGWNLIGHPFLRSQLLTKCQVSDGQTRKNFQEAVDAGWIMEVLYYYEPGDGYKLLTTADYSDDNKLCPWYGYWLYAYEPDLELLIPAPGEESLPYIEITNIQATNITETSALITWETNVPATSRVEYGDTPYYGHSVEDSNLTQTHQMLLENLLPGVTYHYRVISTAPDYRDTSSDDRTFTTLQNFTPPVNPGFETGDLTGWGVIGEGIDGVQTGPWYGDCMPHSGQYFAANAACWVWESGAFYQTFDVCPGRDYTASVWSWVYWVADGSPGSEQQTKSRIGLDPTGGSDPNAPTVVWSDWDIEYSEGTGSWDQISVTATATTGRMTVFLYFYQGPTNNPPGGQWHINAFDDVEVVEH